jgi:hypothetical protein
VLKIELVEIDTKCQILKVLKFDIFYKNGRAEFHEKVFKIKISGRIKNN